MTTPAGATTRRPARVASLLGTLLVALLPLVSPHAQAMRLDSARFTVVAFPQDLPLARTLLAAAVARDTFPGLPRSTRPVVIMLAPDERRFREWIGPAAPEWGAAVAFPEQGRVVMQGRDAGSDAGDPEVVLRHELAHMALDERLGDRVPRWFHEGYASWAAGEWGREELLATNVAFVFRRGRTFAALDSGFVGGSLSADASYALAHRAVAELAALDPQHGLSLFFRYWQQSKTMDAAVRQAYGITLDRFEADWYSRTRRRFGLIAFFADAALLGLVFLVPLGPLWYVRRRRLRRRLEALRAAERLAEERNRGSVLDELLRDVPDLGTGTRPPDRG